MARDGVEPPTPAFSGLRSTHGYLVILWDIALKTRLILSSLLEPKWSQTVQNLSLPRFASIRLVPGAAPACALYSAGWSRRTSDGATFFLLLSLSRSSALCLIHGTPESKAEGKRDYKFDFAGVIAFMIAMVALQIVVTQGNKLGWTSPYALILIAVTVIFGILFFRIEGRTPAAFVDFTLFNNPTFTGATISNFLLNGCDRHP